MEIKHPELKMSDIKVRKAKVDSAGNLFYVLEEHKIPTLLLQDDDKSSENESDGLARKKPS